MGIAVIIAAAQLIVFAQLFVSPQPHEVHTPNAIPIRVQTATSQTEAFITVASESIADLRCQIWHAGRFTGQQVTHNTSPCPDDATLRSAYWPQFAQSLKTLYLAWSRCSVFNVEYTAFNRTLVIHCFTAGTLIPPVRLAGVVAQPFLDLRLAPTDAMLPGSLSIIEDDRVEHFIGDFSSEVPLATATIS
ncbi:MAG: hypothetical protein ACHQ0J_15980 [Candidatus Dormibacterales bacterium]